jgi:hypothetical protein
MPSVLFILLIALAIFGTRKMRELATNILSKGQPWEKLMGLMTEPVSPRNQKLVPPSGWSAELSKLAATPAGQPSWLAKSIGGG